MVVDSRICIQPRAQMFCGSVGKLKIRIHCGGECGDGAFPDAFDLLLLFVDTSSYVVVRCGCDTTCISRCEGGCRPARSEGPELAIVKSEQPLVATLVSGLIVSRESLPASSFPYTPSLHLVPSRPRGLFCLRRILRLLFSPLYTLAVPFSLTSSVRCDEQPSRDTMSVW